MGAAFSIINDSDFWNTSRQDKFFRKLFAILLCCATLFGLLVYIYDVPPQPLLDEPEKKPAITKIQLKKQPEPAPPKPEPKPEPPKPEPKPEPPKPEPKPEPAPAPPQPKPEPAPPKPQPKPEPPKPQPPSQAELRQAARQKVQNTGLAALSSNMQGMTNTADASPRVSASKIVAAEATSDRGQERLYASSSNQGQANLSASTSSQDLDARLDDARTGGATSNSGGNDAVLASSGGGSSGSGTTGAGQRDEASVRRIFEQSKSSASALYNRALRKNPTMSGRVTFNVEIAPNGSVTNASIVDSQLNDPELERKLLLKVRSLQFGAKPVAVLNLTYSYDFLPS